MTHDGMCRRNNDYGESPVPRRNVPIASSLLASCSRMPTLAAKDGSHQQHAAQPRGSPSGRSGALASPAKCVPRDPAPAVPRVADASPLSCEPRDRASSPKGKSFSPRRSREETRSAPRQRLLSRSIGRGQPARQATPDGSADSWVAGSASLRLRLKHAGRAPG